MSSKNSKIVVGMCVYDDLDGAIFSIESIIFHQKTREPVEFVVIDTNPESPQGKLLRRFCESEKIKSRINYFPVKNTGTSQRDLVFQYAPEGSIVFCIDCHVLLPEDNVLQSTADFIDGREDQCLVQGPICQRDGSIHATEWKHIWGGGMLGRWYTDNDFLKSKNKFKEIDGMGLGAFATRKEWWIGFNPLFKGFGGEEFYIHRKYKNRGMKTYCFKGFLWWHRFERVAVPYKMDMADRIHNYTIGFIQEGGDLDGMIEHFTEKFGMKTTQAGYASGIGAVAQEKAKADFVKMVAKIQSGKISESGACGVVSNARRPK